MCAINPKKHMRLVLDIYTTFNMTQTEFIQLIVDKIQQTEEQLNSDMRLRWHFSLEA